MHKMMDPCSINNGSSSAAKSWSSLALEKNDSCAAEWLAHLLAHGDWLVSIWRGAGTKNSRRIDSRE